MKILYTLLASCFFFYSCKKERVLVDVPWQIALNDSEVVNYKVADTLEKYDNIDADDVINKPQFLSFMANLSAMAKDSTKVKEYLQEAFVIDSTGVFDNVIAPIHAYLIKDRPDRKTTMSPILDYELDYVIDLFDKYNLQIPERNEVSEKNARMFYWLCYIRVRDQWYRVPQREANWDTQTKMDVENQKLFNQHFGGKQYPNEQYFKEILQVLLLHSDSADWTYKWLKVYLDVYKTDSQTFSFITHFNRRSYVADDPRIREIVIAYKDLYNSPNP